MLPFPWTVDKSQNVLSGITEEILYDYYQLDKTDKLYCKTVCRCWAEREQGLNCVRDFGEPNDVSTHGVSMLPAHIRKIQRSYDINAKLTVEQEGYAFAVLNANNMMGILSAYQAMLIAIDKARESGILLVLCNHANISSAALYYVEMAVKAGTVGIAMYNAPAQMAPLGGKERLLGTNSLAVGIPGKNEEPFIFDMTTSVVAKSKINGAIRRDETEIPYGGLLMEMVNQQTIRG